MIAARTALASALACLLLTGACGGARPAPATADDAEGARADVEAAIARAAELDRAGDTAAAIVELRRAVGASEAEALAELRVRAFRRLGGLLMLSRELTEAASVLDQAVALERQRSPEGSELLALCLTGRAELMAVLGRYAEARAAHEEALGLALRDGLRSDRVEAEVRFGYGAFLSDMRETDEASVHLTRARDLRARLFGEGSREHLDAMEMVAVALDYGARFDEAEPIFREVLAGREANPRGDDVPRALLNVAVSLSFQERFTDAMPFLERALAAIEAGEVPPELEAQTRLAVGNAQRGLGLLDQALSAYEQCLHIREQLYGASHPSVAVPLYNLGIVAMDQSRFADAVAYLDRALTIRRATLPEGHPWLIETQAQHEEARSALAAAAPLPEEDPAASDAPPADAAPDAAE